MPCPHENEIVLFLRGSLAPAEAHAIELHVDRCSACAALLEGIAEIGAAQADPAASLDRTRLREPDAPHGSGYRLPFAVAGRYVVERKLGEGAMGVVHAAFDPVLGRRVALKVLRPELGAGEGATPARARLLQEARTMAALAHPNVVPVYDAGTLGEDVFLAMELVSGVTLDEWLRLAKRSPREVIAAFRGAALGLAAAHDAGVLHRDFKPQNVLVGDDGRVRVTDFGLARAAPAAPGSSPALAETAAGTLVGTPAYMAPEQLFLRPVDARADQFAFCVALHEALYGAPPFAGATLAERRWHVASTPPAWPRDHRGAPRGVAAVLRRGLAARPEDRFPSMRALLDALDAAASKDDEIHVTLNVVLQALAGAAHVVFMLLWIGAMRAPSAASGTTTTAATAESPDPGILAQGTLVYVVAFAFLMLFWGPAGVLWAPLNALALSRRWRWARGSTLAYAAFAAASCVGLPYAAYVIWSLRRPGVKALFSR